MNKKLTLVEKAQISATIHDLAFSTTCIFGDKDLVKDGVADQIKQELEKLTTLEDVLYAHPLSECDRYGDMLSMCNQFNEMFAERYVFLLNEKIKDWTPNFRLTLEDMLKSTKSDLSCNTINRYGVMWESAIQAIEAKLCEFAQIEVAEMNDRDEILVFRERVKTKGEVKVIDQRIFEVSLGMERYFKARDMTTSLFRVRKRRGRGINMPHYEGDQLHMYGLFSEDGSTYYDALTTLNIPCEELCVDKNFLNSVADTLPRDYNFVALIEGGFYRIRRSLISVKDYTKCVGYQPIWRKGDPPVSANTPREKVYANKLTDSYNVKKIDIHSVPSFGHGKGVFYYYDDEDDVSDEKHHDYVEVFFLFPKTAQALLEGQLDESKAA